MSWRSQGITGSNNIPLGNRRRFGGDDSGDRSATPVKLEEDSKEGLKRGRSPPRCKHMLIVIKYSTTNYNLAVDASIEAAIDGARQRKKRNRWGDAEENKAAGLMGLPTAIMANMTPEQLEAYTLHLRIEEISQKLRINDVVPADGDRYVSPCPLRK